MQTISEVQALAHKTVVTAVQVTIADVYERRIYNGAPVQSLLVKDDTGEMRVSAWEHQPLDDMRGRILVIHSSKAGNGSFGGVTVNHNKNKKTGQVTVELSVSKTGQFQEPNVYAQLTGGAVATPVAAKPAAVQKESNPVVAKPFLNGQSIGMAVKEAITDMREAGAKPDEQALYERASLYLRVSQRLEKEGLAPVKPVDGEKEPF